MRQYIPVITLALLGAFALAVVSGGLIPSDHAVLADHIVAPDNTEPDFGSGNDNRSIAENSPAGVNIGGPISATDADGDVLTYTLGGTDEASFDIAESTGQLITKVGLNEETKSSYSVTVTADDGREGTKDQTVTITVDDVNEPPAAPAPPTVTTGSTQDSETTTLEINWYAPTNTGPAINDYEVEYKESTDTTFVSGNNVSVSGTSATITNLATDTSYQVRVRAKNGEAENTENWSLSATGSTNKEGNAAPVFPGQTTERSVPENTPAGQIIGAAVAATDGNSLEPTYSLAGPAAGLFDIGAKTGQLMTDAGLNHEDEACGYMDALNNTRCTYTVFVVVDDSDGGSDLITVTIIVSDAPEQPTRPAAPTVENVEDDLGTTNTDESTTTLKVSWAAPDTEGPPITNYDIEYREGTSGEFMQPTDGTAVMATTFTITGLDAETPYQVIVKANTDEVNSLWSMPGEGETEASNNPPTFSANTSRNVLENTAEDTDIGAPIMATDPDPNDELTYSLESEANDNDSFGIDESDGQLITKAALDFETKNEYTVTVMAVDKKGASADTTVTISVGDKLEPPLAPPKVTVTSGSETTSLTVAWQPPNNVGRPDITSYEVECRGAGCPASTTHENLNDLTTTFTGLTPFRKYEVRVFARNEEGSGPSASGSEYTNEEGNAIPVFPSVSAERSVAENTARGQPVDAPVEATDDDRDDLTYRLAGVHEDLFTIASTTGQIQTKAGLNHEDEGCYDDQASPTTCEYSVEVKVSDSNGGSDTIEVTIKVTDDDTEAPSAPSRLTVRAAEATEDEPNLDPAKMLLVTWNEPQNGGPPIASYAVRYQTSVDGTWISSDDGAVDNIIFDGDNDGTNRSAIITGLDHNTPYLVGVRAKNGESDATENWSGQSETKTHFHNSRPKFSSRNAVELHVDENTPRNEPIGVPVDATDIDGDTLTYTLDGVHKDLFTIERRSGHIRTKANLNFEERSSYSLTVRVDDGRRTDDSSATISVTISVRDEDESPSTPARPTVSGIAGSTSDVRVNWQPPTNPGPPIVDYDVQYKTGSEGFKPWEHDGKDTSTIITGLRAGTTYEVQVRASNGEGQSEWSLSGTGSPDADPANNEPVYTGGVRNFTVEENTGAGVNIGTPVEATDSDDDDLTYSLEGADSASFEIVSVSGQIQTKAGEDYNYEATKNSHSVTVRAADDRGGSATVAVTITVTDSGVDEPPEAPDAPTVEATSNSSTSLDVSWTAPENPGPPITDYDYQYKETASSSWTVVDNTTITRTSATISSLDPNTSYDVQVRARNADGLSAWSGTGTGSTSEPVANRAPVFSEGASTTRTVSETAQASSRIGAPVAATDADAGATLAYSLEGADAASFGINPANGQLLTLAGVTLDRSTYTVDVVASDGSATSRITVTITVTPNRAPVFSEGATATRSVREDAASDTAIGSPVTATDADPGARLTYRVEGTDAGSFTINTANGQLLTSAALDADTKATYTVDVVASDGSLEARITVTITVTATNMAPVFSEGASTTRTVSENAQASSPVGAPVTATDADNDTLVYSLDGTDASSFDITSSGGQLLVGAGTVLDASTKSTYSVTVVANDGSLDARITVTITVTPTNRAPVFSEGGTATRSVREDAASGTAIGSPVTATDADPGARLTYRVEGTDAGSFTINTANGQLLTSAALDADTKATYTVDVVASDGSLEARITVTITVTALPTSFGCATRGAVSDASNTGLVSDCEALLDARDVLVGLGGPLNWSASTPIAQWDGVTVDETSMRVTTLDLRRSRLKGVISSDLSRVTALRELYLQDNHLTGPIPSELGSMTELRQLRLRSNGLSGPLPAALGSLTNLTHLLLSDNDLSGSIPSQIGDMSSLYWLDVGQNNISGTLPAELGNLSQLGRLYVYDNDLTGSIPSTLGNLTGLTHIVAQENDLSGSIPVQLGNMSALVWMGLYDNDLSGAIPTQLSRLSNLQRLYLSNNDLTGTIPRELGQLSALTDLWLDDNGLSGTIPSELDQLTNLVRWRMRGNDFTGCVPAGLAAVRSTDLDQLGLPVCSGS